MSSKCLHSTIPSPESHYREETGSGEARTHGNTKKNNVTEDKSLGNSVRLERGWIRCLCLGTNVSLGWGGQMILCEAQVRGSM